MPCCATCRGHRSPRWPRCRFPPTAQPLVVEGRSWGWPGRWAAQGPLQVRPCKLGRAIHGAYAPAQPTRPATDNFRARPPRKRKRRSKAEAGRSARHPRMAWIYCPSSETVGGGRCGAAGPWRHGPEACLGRVGQDAQPRSCRVRRTAHTSKAPSSRAPMDGLTACPAAPHRPAKPTEIQSRCRCCSCGCFQRVQGSKPCRKNN